MGRQKFIAGNWKMFTTAATGRGLAASIAAGVKNSSVKVAVCPPFPYLPLIAQTLEGTSVLLGAQNLYPEKEGAFTGETSPQMLREVGCQCVIVGHSERRHGLGETDEFVNRKVLAAIGVGLDVILCVGETLDERQSNRTMEVLKRQIAFGLAGINPAQTERLVIAYEPVWAIGTGKVATPDQAQEAHAHIRQLVASQLGGESAERLVIQYGGSAKPENVPELFRQPDIDGALVGGASLVADFFLAIIHLAE